MARPRLPEPRWQTPFSETPAGSWGPDVEAWAWAELGLRFDRWQRRGLNRALSYRIVTLPALSLPDAPVIRSRDVPRLLHRIYLLSVARQQGKTGAARSVLGWALTARRTPEWTRLLGIAHDRTQARIPYEAVLSDLEPIQRRTRRGLALTRYLGIRSDLYGRHREYHVGSKEARNAIRSSSNDLALFDEIRTQVNYATWAALEPTTRARPDPLILGLSTAGDDRSVVLRDWWERGRRIIRGEEPGDGFGMTWYAAEDDAAPDDPRAIRAANPAVAEGRIPIGVVAGSIRTLTPATYRQETLNLWSEGADEWLPAGLWHALRSPRPDSATRVVLGAETTPGWTRATVTVGIATDAGAWVGVAGEIDASAREKPTLSPGELIRLVRQLVATWKVRQLAYSGQTSAAPHLRSWCQANGIDALELTARQVRTASALFRSELIGRRLHHADDPLLAQQMRVARPSASIDAGADWHFSLRDSLGDIDALRAAAWAAYGAIAPDDELVPQVFT